jgi:hypothetical protein
VKVKIVFNEESGGRTNAESDYDSVEFSTEHADTCEEFAGALVTMAGLSIYEPTFVLMDAFCESIEVEDGRFFRYMQQELIQLIEKLKSFILEDAK